MRFAAVPRKPTSKKKGQLAHKELAMACRSCHLGIPATLCQVCRYLTEIMPPEEPVTCRHCRAPVARPAVTGSLCQLCRALLQIVRNNRWLAYAHAEWDQENFLLAKRKRELLGQGGGQQDTL